MKISKGILIALGIGLVFAIGTRTSYAAVPVCTKLATNLSYGNENSRVTALQNFLVATGYMTVKPNGYFGPSTRAAVRAFQRAQKISTTGTAGPLTRAAIEKISCVVPVQSGVPVIPPSIPTPSTSSTTSPAVSTTTVSTGAAQTTPTPAPVIKVLAPTAGESLKVGSTHMILWDSAFSGQYTIVLEDESGTGVGIIFANRSGGTNYTWKIGDVYTYVGGEQKAVDVSSGTYRIRIRSYSPYAEKVSALFSIVDEPITISAVMPNTLPNDSTTAGALYGSGFKASSKIYFYSSYTNILANILYVSRDGKILVFSIPQSIQPGQYSAFITNNTSAAARFNLTVTAALTQ